MTTPTIDEQDILRLLALDDDQVLQRVALDLGLDAGLDRADVEAMKARARVWLDNNVERIAEAVCGSEKVKSAYASAEDALIVAAVADCLGGHGFVSVAVLLTKRGVEGLCRERWKL